MVLNAGTPPLAVTLGEPAGIGVEIIGAAFTVRQSRALSPFYVLGDPELIAARFARVGLVLAIEETTPEMAPSIFPQALPVVPVGYSLRDSPGQPDPSQAPAVIHMIESAVEHIKAGRASALVTAPIHKASLYAQGFLYPGHTEFLGSLAKKHWPDAPVTPVMMLAAPDLKTVPVTVHQALATVAESLTQEKIISITNILAHDLIYRFKISAPRIAVTGLNPHAGEAGSMGHEEETIIKPALAALRGSGIDVRGPYPADTLFHARARQSYDAVLAMYHDQALIPVKTLAFDAAVNVTLGLPFIRTSPDHGTALDIAGRGLARPESMIAALKLAAELAAYG